MSPLTSITGSDLLAKEFPPMRWAVPGLVPEGLVELAGSPKVGKSFLTVDMGISIATGQPVLGGIDVEEGDVLIMAMEDGQRRLQGRLKRMLGARPLPERLTLATGTATFPEAVAHITGWLNDHPDARLVVIDVLAKIRPQTSGKQNAYAEDYGVLAPLQEIATARGIAILVVTHLRKAGADDVFMEISGSAGVTGAADAILVIKRARNETEAELHLTGRDVAEGTFEIECDPEDMRWRLVGGSLQTAAERAEEARQTAGLGDRSSEVVRLINEHPDGLSPKDVADAGIEGMDHAQAKVYLSRLAKNGRIAKSDRGVYKPLKESVTSVTLADPATENPANTGHTAVTHSVTAAARTVTGLEPPVTQITEVTHPLIRARGEDLLEHLPGETYEQWEARIHATLDTESRS